MFGILKQRKAKLHNGKTVCEGDRLFFKVSDGNIHFGAVERRKFDCEIQTLPHHHPNKNEKRPQMMKKGTLFFWNNCFLIEDYITADLAKDI